MNILVDLKKLIGEDRVTINETILSGHSHDESYHQPKKPDVVVFPRSTDEVSMVMKYAHSHMIPVTAFGLGTSLEGHVIPVNGGITVDLSQMNQILEVREGDFLVTVEPGVTRSQLNKDLKKYGLFFSVDPGADATLGGMAATNASGTTSVRYGIMRDQVRDMEVVLADGTIIRTGSLAAKSSSGYHLNGLFVGSEGTLGIITKLTLRLYGIPEAVMAARATFPSITAAIDAVTAILRAGIPIARVELVDDRSVKEVNKYFQLTYEEVPTLFLEFHGNEAGLKQDLEFTQEIVNSHDCSQFLFESGSKERHQLWEVRHNLAYAFIHGAPGRKMMVTDVCVPLSELANAISNGKEALEKSGLDGTIVGHVGDGNYHILMMLDLDNVEEKRKADELNETIVKFALERGGTCTGEHGVGFGKGKYQRLEHGAAYDVMKQVKLALDPLGILNPGKIFI
ncbi:FAD-linked oxidase C-terminal domain-containing protein [Bacillaceae bacterium IKA-2]|nr:FAD-linked oxidase C-terminal domain-containing protein [Bacillaceae bacterium IKA-2]